MFLCVSLNHNVLNYNYKILDNSLDKVNMQRDLGVIFQENMSFTEHITTKIQDAMKVMGFIVRNSRNFSVEVCLRLFDALVLPRIEYGSVIWSPLYNVWIDSIEGVQRRFLKHMYFRRYGHYPERGCDDEYLLGIFNRMSLRDRRTKTCLCYLFKILKGGIDAPDILGQLPFAVQQVSLRSSKTFYLDFPRTNVYKSSPIYQMCMLYNKYASDIDIDTTSTVKFNEIIKNKLMYH